MANNKGLIILLVTMGTLALAVGVGVYLFLPRASEVTAQAEDPQVIRVSIVPEEGTQPETSNQEVPAQPNVSPIEVPRTTGLMPQPPSSAPASPPLPIPAAPGQVEAGPRTTAPTEEKTSDRPDWTHRNQSPTSPSTPTIRVTNQAPQPASVRPQSAPTSTTATRPSTSGAGFWVQIGAFQSQTQAETAANRLSARGWKAVITTYQSGTSTFYRVRLGPWTTNKEAQTFLERLKSVGGYENAFVVRG